MSAKAGNNAGNHKLPEKFPRTTQGAEPASGSAPRLYFDVKSVGDRAKKFQNYEETSEFFVAFFVGDGKARVGRSA